LGFLFEVSMLLTDLTQEELKEMFHYNPETGDFTRLVVCGSYKPGTIAGTVAKYGYKQIRINGTIYFSHRLAWLYMTGEWPAECIDHINGISGDNRIDNLRACTTSQNNMNRAMNKSNRSGFKGVYKPSGRNYYVAQIKINGEQVPMPGSYATAEEASVAYEAKAKELFGEFYYDR